MTKQVFAGLILLTTGVQAETRNYLFVNTEGGSWGEIGNWRIDGKTMPTTLPGDNGPGDLDWVFFTNGTYTVTLDKDRSVARLVVANSYEASVTSPQGRNILLDLQGHALVASNEFSSSSAHWATKRNYLFVTNGTVTCKRGWTSGGGMTGFNVDTGNSFANEVGYLKIAGPGTHAQAFPADHSTSKAQVGSLFGGQDSSFEILNGATFDCRGVFMVGGARSGVTVSGVGSMVSNDYCQLSPGNTVIIEKGARFYAGMFGLGYVENGMNNGDGTARFVVDNALFRAGYGVDCDRSSGLGYHCTFGYAPYTTSIPGGHTTIVTNGGILECGYSALLLGSSSAQTTICTNFVMEIMDRGVVRAMEGRSMDMQVGIAHGHSHGLHIRDGELYCDGYLGFGGNTTYVANWARATAYSSNNWLRVSGTNSLVALSGTTSPLRLYNGTKVCFDIPSTGYCRTPIQCPNGAVAVNGAAGSGLPQNPAKLEVVADAFIRRCPGKKVVLISAGADSSVAYAELIANATIVTASRSRTGGGLSVENGGKDLCYTAPLAPGMMLILR